MSTANALHNIRIVHSRIERSAVTLMCQMVKPPSTWN
ncbi:unnamed protein product [Toxocara canis]|uniref:Transposase n=1 Tax=Toxocara canis TaxID=6265 RepID=A0A183TZX8_TOXCA|nr:unnamed protein product [Toxocara canis]